MRVAVDVGSVRVGVAACDPDGYVASPVGTLARDEKSRSDLRELAREVSERAAVEVLVGLPLSMNGSEGRAAALVRTYAEQLAAMVAPVPVRLVDERLSTVGAHRSLHESGRKGRKHRSVVDQVAAVWFLQGALDAERTSGRAPGRVLDTAVPDDDADRGARPGGTDATRTDDGGVPGAGEGTST
ncbi:putative Holliday junction resolvase [Kineococcus xinjiangensis]|uniref:Putative pre-16S rRNA nuclease n=1 Tax=Kineococcus xinjiangensis TaxID=512762 RepID=A0A2S6IP85_9ACTN|nr:Holliday junction resolvase RuvX [Kineococcus xinjiangensis]PPK95991.1 putative Holliday junction resolvase [Kineococcus xinjiangensis]